LGIAMWKTPRAKDHYEANRAGFVRQVTDQAFQACDDRLRLHILMALDGVGVPVASTLLHFAFPDTYPILDVRALTTLTKAGLWSGNEPGASTPADWLKYTRLMRRLAKKLRIDLRTLDRALWAFDKHGGEVQQGASS
jgi:thermostable 8-oxoguanine DNA glycosylase